MEKTRREQLIELVKAWTEKDGQLVVFTENVNGTGFMKMAGIIGKNKSLIAGACMRHPILTHVLLDGMAMTFLEGTGYDSPTTQPEDLTPSGSFKPQTNKL